PRGRPVAFRSSRREIRLMLRTFLPGTTGGSRVPMAADTGQQRSGCTTHGIQRWFDPIAVQRGNLQFSRTSRGTEGSRVFLPLRKRYRGDPRSLLSVGKGDVRPPGGNVGDRAPGSAGAEAVHVERPFRHQATLLSLRGLSPDDRI